MRAAARVLDAHLTAPPATRRRGVAWPPLAPVVLLGLALALVAPPTPAQDDGAEILGENVLLGCTRPEGAAVDCEFRLVLPERVTDVRATLDDRPLPRPELLGFPQPGAVSAVLFLIDVSDPGRAAAVAAGVEHIRRMLRAAEPHHRFGLATFDARLQVRVALGAAPAAVAQALDDVRAEGLTTELYRNTLAAVTLLGEYPADRRALIILSDGQAEDRAYFHRDVIEAARRHRVSIDGLGYPRSVSLSVALQTLRRMADETGGRFVEGTTALRLADDYLDAPFAALDSGGTLSIDLQPALDAGAAGDATLGLAWQLAGGRAAAEVTLGLPPPPVPAVPAPPASTQRPVAAPSGAPAAGDGRSAAPANANAPGIDTPRAGTVAARTGPIGAAAPTTAMGSTGAATQASGGTGAAGPAAARAPGNTGTSPPASAPAPGSNGTAPAAAAPVPGTAPATQASGNTPSGSAGSSPMTPGATPRGQSLGTPTAPALVSAPGAPQVHIPLVDTHIALTDLLTFVLALAGLVTIVLLVALLRMLRRRGAPSALEAAPLPASVLAAAPGTPGESGPTFAFLDALDGSGERHAINSAAFRIGRHTDNELPLDDPSISRHHAQIQRKRDGSFSITDLESMNGVFVNDKRVSSASIKEGDLVELGDVRMRFSLMTREEPGGDDTVMLRTALPGSRVLPDRGAA